MSSVKTETQSKTKVFKLSAKVGLPKNDSKMNSENTEELPIKEIETNNNEEESIETEEFKPKVVWFNAIGFLVLHIAAAYGTLLLFKAKFLTIVWVLFMALLSGLATTMGAHRLYAHRTYKANKWIRLLLVTFQTLAGQNCLWVWIRDHRQHHKYSDTDGDPHNSSRGFFFCHIGWLMMKKHPEVFRKGKGIDMSDINQDPIVMFQKKYYKTLFMLLAIMLPTLVPYFLWNESLWNSFFICFVSRLIISLNITWLVNSAAHIYGTRPFTKDIAPVENSFVSFFGLGEGWHNYHHTFPWDYRAAEYGQHFNITTSVIDYCAKKGWVYDIKAASSDLVKKHSIKKGDGTHPEYGKFTPGDWINAY